MLCRDSINRVPTNRSHLFLINALTHTPALDLEVGTNLGYWWARSRLRQHDERKRAIVLRHHERYRPGRPICASINRGW